MSTFRGPREANRGRWRGGGCNAAQSRGGSDDEQKSGNLQRSSNTVRGSPFSRAGTASRQSQGPQKEPRNHTSTWGKNMKTMLSGSKPRNPSPLSSSTENILKDQSWRYSSAEGSSSYQQNMSDLHLTLKKNREKERKDAIRNGFLANPEKPTSLANAVTPVGTCQDMCPEFERVERIVQKMVDKCEKTTFKSSDTKVPCEEHMVKRFRRSAAGYDEQLPSDIRPPLVLQKTLNYLFEEVVGGSEALSSVHKFVWDRTRSIRNDFSIQQVTKTDDVRVAIDCFERIARFHILSLHQLSQPGLDNGGFDHYQEREQLNNTLLSLMYYYHDSRHKLTSPNEAEFRAYCIIFEIQNQQPDIEDRAQNWPKHILGDPRVQTAMKLYAAAGNTMDKQGPLRPHAVFPIAQGNYGRFWSVVGSNAVSYLLACVTEIYFNLVRSMALEAIWKAYRRGGQVKLEDLILRDLVTFLGFDNEDQVQGFCEDHGFVIGEREDGESFLDISSVTGKWLTDSVNRRPQIHSKNLVERKRLGRTLPAVINSLSASQARAQLATETPTTTEGLPAVQEKEEPLFFGGESDEDFSKMKSPPAITSNETENRSPGAASIDPFTKLPSLRGTRDSTLFAKSPAANGENLSSVLPQPPGSIPTFTFVPKASSTTSEDAKTIAPPSIVSSQPSAIFGQSSQAAVSPRGGFGQPSILSSLTANANTNSFFSNNSTSPTDMQSLQNQSMSSTSIPTNNPTTSSPLFQSLTKPLATTNKPYDFATQSMEQSLLSSSSPGMSSFTNNTASFTSCFSPQPVFSFQQQSTTANASDTFRKVEPVTSNSTFMTPSSIHDTHQSSESPKSLPNASELPRPQPSTSTSTTTKSSILPTTPSILQATPRVPKVDLRPKLLDQLANTVVREKDGLLQQFVEYTIGPIILKAIEKNKLERSREEAARGRQFLLRTKYLRKWKENAWKRGLLRKGKERRSTFAQSMQALAQSTREARSTSRVSGSSSTFNEPPLTAEQLAMPPPPQPSSRPEKRKSLPGGSMDHTFSHEDTTPRQKRKFDMSAVSADSNTGHHRQPHHKRSRTLGDSNILTYSAGVSKPGPLFDPKSSFLNHSSPMSDSMMKRARRLAPPGPTDTTRTDYFRLKALGIDPDTLTVPLVRKRRMFDQLESESKKIMKPPAPEFRHCRTEFKKDSSSSIPPRNSESPNPEPRRNIVDEDDDDELFAQMRQVRDAMSESITWFREEREKSTRSRSTSESQERPGETEKQRRLREFKSTPSRTEVRLRTTGANGLLPRDWKKSSSHGADAKGSFDLRNSSVSPQGIEVIGNGYGSHRNGIYPSPESGGDSGGNGTGASVDDAIEL